VSYTDDLSTLDGFKSSPGASGEIALLLLRSPLATYGYPAARKHALENYGKEAVAFGDKCLRGSAPLEAAEPKLETGRANLRPQRFPRPAVLAQSRPPDNQIVTVGPWTIATTYKADKFDNCTMSRSTDELGISVVWTKEGQLLFVNSPKWKLDRGKAYRVRVVAGSRSVEAEALAESKSVTIALADRPLTNKLRTANILEIRGEGATLLVPLDGSAAALERLEACFNKNSREGVEANPFVAPSRTP